MESRSVHAIAAELARALGHEWRVGPAYDHDGHYQGDHRAVIYGPDGAEILLHTEDWRVAMRGRVILSGCAPFDLAAHIQRDSLPAISVTRAKSAAHIARNVTQRLLPPYHAALTAARTRKREDDALTAARDAVLSHIAELWNARVSNQEQGRLSFGLNGGGIHGELRIFLSDRDASLSLRVTAAQVIPLAQALQPLMTSAPPAG